MRHLCFIPFALFLISCGGKDTSEVTDQKKERPDNNEIAYLDSLREDEIQDSEDEVFLENLPESWVMLTDEEGNGRNLFIQEWCEAETQNFSFKAGKGENWEIYLGYGQDGEICDITFFEAHQSIIEEKQIVEGKIQFKAVYDESVRHVDFWWNKDEMVGHFEGMGMSSPWFVPQEDFDNYALVKEDCEGLWE